MEMRDELVRRSHCVSAGGGRDLAPQAKDAVRIVAHIDMDAFYAQIEQVGSSGSSHPVSKSHISFFEMMLVCDMLIYLPRPCMKASDGNSSPLLFHGLSFDHLHSKSDVCRGQRPRMQTRDSQMGWFSSHFRKMVQRIITIST